jgi:5'-nucleotidase
MITARVLNWFIDKKEPKHNSMRILIANDDGIYSPGLMALAEVAQKFGEVRIVAPDVEQSSMGHAITASRPLKYKKTPLNGFEAYRVNGTPADCVTLGAYNWDKVDLVLSGINLGTNLGNAIWHSGTLAAAKQATLLGIRGIALSTSTTEGEPDFDLLKPYVEKVLKQLINEQDLSLININFPRQPEGIMWTKQSVRQYDGKIVPTKDPYDRPVYWYCVRPIEEMEEGTDRWAMARNCASITPLRLNLTHEHKLAELKEKYPF